MKTLNRRDAVKVVGLGAASVLTACNTTMKNIGFSASANSDGSVNLQATVVDSVPVLKVEFYENQTLLGAMTAAPYTWQKTYTAADNGTHTYYAKVYDDAGNTIASAPSSVLINVGSGNPADGTPPTVSLAASSNNVSSASSITLTASAADNVAVTRVEFYEGTTFLAARTSAPYTHDIAFTSAENGTHNYTAKAFDAAANSASSAIASVVVNIASNDTSAPTVTLVASSNTVTSASPVTLTATANDNVAVTRVEFYEGATLLTTKTAAPYTHDIAFTNANNGTHNYTAKAFDAASNTGSSAVVTVNVNIANTGDTTPPTVSLAASSNTVTAAGSVTLAATATDNVGVTKVEFYEGATLLATKTATPYTHSIAFTSSNNGAHNYTAKAYDAAANAANSAAQTITVNIAVPDTTPPTVSLASSSSNVTTASSITLTATASDNIGVSKVEIYEGATLLATKTAAPYTHTIAFTNANNGTHAYTAKAYDAAGNVATSTAVSVVVNIAATPTGTRIALYSQLPAVGSFVLFNANKSVLYRSSALVTGGIATNGMNLIAYSMVCPHDKCTVGSPSPTTHVMTCPCHQATFNAETTAFTAPAKSGLPKITIRGEADGVYI